jgi:hypothetical protein
VRLGLPILRVVVPGCNFGHLFLFAAPGMLDVVEFEKGVKNCYL